MRKQPANPEGPSGELTFQLKIHLLGINPQIYRRIQIRGDTSIALLHHVFQVAMGWDNYHLHSFHIWGKEYGIPYSGGHFADDANQVQFDDFAWRVNDKFTYTYDFGDYWQHQVRIEKIIPSSNLPDYPVCLSGKRACPPEDVGGIIGYERRTLEQFMWAEDLLERLVNGENVLDDDVPGWFWTFHPERFDRARVNQHLVKVYQLKGRRDFLLGREDYEYFFEHEPWPKLNQNNQMV